MTVGGLLCTFGPPNAVEPAATVGAGIAQHHTVDNTPTCRVRGSNSVHVSNSG